MAYNTNVKTEKPAMYPDSVIMVHRSLHQPNAQS